MCKGRGAPVASSRLRTHVGRVILVVQVEWGEAPAECPGKETEEPGHQPRAQSWYLLTAYVGRNRAACPWHSHLMVHPTQTPLAVGTAQGHMSADRNVCLSKVPTPADSQDPSSLPSRRNA